ncbi:MAG TPA: hemolysin family protein [Gemmatimonadaceae bacterium]|nr:hemolysin family protein [Gemmatimonadaceae bacterium]
MTIPALVLALVVGAISALCAAVDAAMLAVDDDEVAADPALAALLARRDRVHRSLTVARFLGLPLAAALAAQGAGLARQAPALAMLSGLAIAVAVLILAELTPRTLGEAGGRDVIQRVLPLLRPVTLALSPLAAATAEAERVLRSILAPKPRDDVERDESEARGSADASRPRRTPVEPVQGVFALGSTEVQTVLVPRIDIIGIERETPWAEVRDRVRSAEHSRLPVYRDTIDHVIGILYAKDLLRAVIEDTQPEGGWLRLVRPAAFVPEGKPIDQQLRDFKLSRSHIAIVVDEYGGTAGLVTIEDILEEIVGEIRDEHDQEELPIEAEEDRRFWVAGRVPLDDLSEALHHEFAHEDVSTVGGLIFSVLGRIPRAGEELRLNGFRVVVERVVRRRIERVYFERLESAVPQVDD